jgi:hypothetical protein
MMRSGFDRPRRHSFCRAPMSVSPYDAGASVSMRWQGLTPTVNAVLLDMLR